MPIWNTSHNKHNYFQIKLSIVKMINRFALTVVLLATTAFAVDFQWNDCGKL